MGCGESAVGTRSQPKITAAQAAAVIAARDWVKSQNLDPAAATYTPVKKGDGWEVRIEDVPARPGGHTTLLLDANHAVKKVFPGA
jgi:hypothetical protein